MAKSRYASVHLTDLQNAAVLNIAKRYKISQYATVNRILDIGLAVLLHAGNDLESARKQDAFSRSKSSSCGFPRSTRKRRLSSFSLPKGPCTWIRVGGYCAR